VAGLRTPEDADEAVAFSNEEDEDEDEDDDPGSSDVTDADATILAEADFSVVCRAAADADGVAVA
jgi:hypothetical protein